MQKNEKIYQVNCQFTITVLFTFLYLWKTEECSAGMIFTGRTIFLISLDKAHHVRLKTEHMCARILVEDKNYMPSSTLMLGGAGCVSIFINIHMNPPSLYYE